MVHGIDTAKTWKKKKINLWKHLMENKRVIENYIARRATRSKKEKK